MLVLLLLAASPQFSEGMRLFSEAQFERAAPLLKEALASGSLGASQTKDARLALAQACYYNSDKRCAEAQVQKLVKAKHVLEPKLLPPDFVAFYQRVAAELTPAAPPPPQKPKPKPTPSPPTPEKKPVPTLEEEEAPAGISAVPYKPVDPLPPTVVAPAEPVRPPWYLLIIPFGVGHFVQGDKIAGAIFLSLEVALIGTNVALAIATELSLNAQMRIPAQNAGLYWAQQGTAIAAYTTLVFGLIDALVLSPRRMSISKF